VIEGLRAEFPGVSRALEGARLPPVARTSLIWAFVAAVGASLIVGAIAEVFVLGVSPVLFPPTREQPSAFPLRELWDGAGEIAAGAVAVRAGGSAALALYVAYELALLVTALPGRMLFCSRAGPANQRVCDLGAMVVDRWPLWLALAVGVVTAMFLMRQPGSGSNRLLRAAGLLSLCVTIGATAGALWQYAARPASEPIPGEAATFASLGGLFWIGWIVGAALAGLILARSSVAAAVLLAVLVVAPSFAFGIPMIRGQVGAPVQPPLFVVAQWAWAWLPIAASVVMFAARELARRNRVVAAL
jgi:hypothetical protein